MSETCRTCGRLRLARRELLGKPITSHECYYGASQASNGLLIPHVRHLDDEACAGWTSDSVEQVALDMLALIRAARKHPIALDPNRWAGGQMIYPLPEQTFEDRLRELGIEVGE